MSEKIVFQLHEEIAQLKAQLERMTAMYECEKAEKTALRNYISNQPWMPDGDFSESITRTEP